MFLILRHDNNLWLVFVDYSQLFSLPTLTFMLTQALVTVLCYMTNANTK